MGGVNLLDTDTSVFGFVRDELLELVEVPRVDTRLRTALADTFEVFHPNDGVLELFRERDETTGEFMIQIHIRLCYRRWFVKGSVGFIPALKQGLSPRFSVTG